MMPARVLCERCNNRNAWRRCALVLAAALIGLAAAIGSGCCSGPSLVVRQEAAAELERAAADLRASWSVYRRATVASPQYNAVEAAGVGLLGDQIDGALGRVQAAAGRLAEVEIEKD